MTSRNKQLLVYVGLLVVILFSPWSALSKVLFLGLFSTIFYAVTTRQQMLEGQVHSLNHNRLTFWMGTLCWVIVHLMGSPVRILGEAVLFITLLSWSLQAFKFNQIDLQKTLLYLFFIGFVLFLVHTPIEIIFGIKGLVYFDGYFLVPFLLLKIYIESRILYRLLIDLGDKMRLRAYRP